MAQKSLTKPQRKRNKPQRINELVSSEFFEGPIPHPIILRQYEQISPGAADRILVMAERQSLHRQEIEKAVIHSDITNEKRGMNYSLIITLGLMLIGAILLYFNRDTAGYLSLFGPSIFHAGNYVYQKLNQQKEGDKEKEGR